MRGSEKKAGQKPRFRERRTGLSLLSNGLAVKGSPERDIENKSEPDGNVTYDINKESRIILKLGSKR